MKKTITTFVFVLLVVLSAMAKLTYSRDLEQKAILGDDQAMFELSVCYRNGYGVSVDADKANYWLERAAEEGNPKASLQMDMLNNKTGLSDAKRRELAAVEKRERDRLLAQRGGGNNGGGGTTPDAGNQTFTVGNVSFTMAREALQGVHCP